MKPPMIASLRSLLADPDRLDREALFAVLDDTQAARVLACLAPPGTLAQIAAALHVGWSWSCDGWEQQIDELVAMITDPRCPRPNWILSTWSCIPNAVGVLRDRTDILIAWAEERLDPKWYDDLATLLGPSNAAARLLMRSPFLDDIGRTLRRWSMVTDPNDPTAWQAMIDADLRQPLRRRADPSWAFPAWRWNDAVNPDDVLTEIVDDLFNGWSPDHPSIRGRIGWLEPHDPSNPYVAELALVASIGGSAPLAEAVCTTFIHDVQTVHRIAQTIPWTRLHPDIQTTIDTSMSRYATWTYALGSKPIANDPTINADLLLWRIDKAQWNTSDPFLRRGILFRSDIPPHCYGWGVHPDLVARWGSPKGKPFRFWNPDVPPDDLPALDYADLLRAQSTLQDARTLIALLAVLPPDRRARFEQIIDWEVNPFPKSSDESPWDWTVWAALPASKRLRRLRSLLRVLWGDRTTKPAYRAWRARSHLVDTVVVGVRTLLDSKRAPHILAALLAQVPALRVHMPKPGPPLPFPDDLDAAQRAQIERLPLTPDAQAYAAWGLWVIARSADVGADLIALHPDVAVVLAPLLSPDQQKTVAASPAAQEWDSMTNLSWTATCETTERSIPPRIQRRIR